MKRMLLLLIPLLLLPIGCTNTEKKEVQTDDELIYEEEMQDPELEEYGSSGNFSYFI